MEIKVKWYEFSNDNYDIYGINNSYLRMPEVESKKISESVYGNSRAAAGGRIRFSTNSEKIYISANVVSQSGFGFDIYQMNNGREEYCATFRKPDCFIHSGEYFSEVELPKNKGKTTYYTLNFPQYGHIEAFKLGIDENAVLGKGFKYINDLPVVYYGSSITQGAWATRPGSTYVAQISQKYNLNYVNLGFLGSAHGEHEMAEYISNLSMSAFVCDYDHNSYDMDELKERHLPFYLTVRKKHPDIPYIIITRPDYYTNQTSIEEMDERVEIILETYRYAKSIGDENVYFIHGKTLFEGDEHLNCTRDGTHPNDLGFFRMSQVIGKVIANSLKII